MNRHCTYEGRTVCLGVYLHLLFGFCRFRRKKKVFRPKWLWTISGGFQRIPKSAFCLEWSYNQNNIPVVFLFSVSTKIFVL